MACAAEQLHGSIRESGHSPTVRKRVKKRPEMRPRDYKAKRQAGENRVCVLADNPGCLHLMLALWLTLVDVFDALRYDLRYRVPGDLTCKWAIAI